MKKLFLLLTVVFYCLGVNAQEATTDYIYSVDGFEVKTAVYIDKYNIERISTGIYSKDGKILLAAMPEYNTFYVIDGSETICSGAFQSTCDCRIYFPSSVKYIAPDAITSRMIILGASNIVKYSNKFGGIVDGVKEKSVTTVANAPAYNPNATEVARYNAHGVRLSEPTNGVNIVQMSDGTTEKVLVK